MTKPELTGQEAIEAIFADRTAALNRSRLSSFIVGWDLRMKGDPFADFYSGEEMVDDMAEGWRAADAASALHNPSNEVRSLYDEGWLCRESGSKDYEAGEGAGQEWITGWFDCDADRACLDDDDQDQFFVGGYVLGDD